MKELNDIILAYDKAVSQNKQSALQLWWKWMVLLIETGARMLVTEDGEITGAISGVVWKAMLCARRSSPCTSSKTITGLRHKWWWRKQARSAVGLQWHRIYFIWADKEWWGNNPVNLLKKIAQQRKDAVSWRCLRETRVRTKRHLWLYK